MTIRKCEEKECQDIAGFFGMGKVLCWHHYSVWILSYRASDSLMESERHPQMPLDFGDVPEYNTPFGYTR